MAKAIDRVKWTFLSRVMLQLGFKVDWVKLVMRCVTSASFSFLINGHSSGHIIHSRGTKQGDPVFPFLFLFHAEGLTGLITHAVERKMLCGYRICALALVILHLLFADDTIIFCGADCTQAGVPKNILYNYERASGPTVNFSKTDVSFSKGVSAERRNQITLLLDIREVLSHNKYLGAPTFVGKSRKKPFLFLIDRIKKRMSQWMDKLASWAGREVLIKAIAQAIPTYTMSVFKLTKTACQTIQSSIIRFWWGYNQEDCKIH